MEDKKSKKFLWIYTIALFSLALILVVVTSFRHQEAQESAKSFEQKYQEQVVYTNELEGNIKKLEMEKENFEKEIEKYEKIKEENLLRLEEVEGLIDQKNLLIQAQYRYGMKNYEEAKAAIERILPEKLPQDEKEIYDFLKEKLEK